MPIWRLQVEIAADTQFPRDRMVITPHFDDAGVTTNPDGLCEDLATALVTWGMGTREVEVSAYDAQGTPPVFPQGNAKRNVGLAPASASMREVALCLSFYGERNLPRQRGRLYIPWILLAGNKSVRPIASEQQKVADLVPIFAALGGADVDWVVYSRVTDTAHPVTNWWVDDEWDVIRSRGLRPTSRLSGTTSG